MPILFPQPRSAIVIMAYRTPYHQPITFKAGDILAIGRVDERHPGWVWTTTPSGAGGWAPLSALAITDDHATARQDYDARELDLDVGQVLTLKQEESGWFWAQRGDGASGWVPADHVQLLD